jgi:hypothetical protein
MVELRLKQWSKQSAPAKLLQSPGRFMVYQGRSVILNEPDLRDYLP